MGTRKEAFVAYPGNHPEVVDCIRTAVEISEKGKLQLVPWEHLPIVGLKIDNVIRERLITAELLIADITHPNFNVFYEIGYAIANDKPIIPILNVSIEGCEKNLQATGIFDTVGYLKYVSSDELIGHLKNWSGHAWTTSFRKPLDHAQPMFILDTYRKTNFRNSIISAVSNNSVKYRAYDPEEVPRLTAANAIGEVSSSAGVIIPILSSDIVDSRVHNLRAAFVAGLAHGLEVQPLILQYGNGPAPLDFRDFIINSTSKTETEAHVSEYCAEVLIRNQRAARRAAPLQLGLLNKINLGASAAERETEHLPDYFVPTAEYARAARGESGIVSGRKGSGKSAIFFRARDELSRQRFRLVVELRPAAHNLSELRENLLGVVGHGVFDHTIAAFWHYILYVELVLCVREVALKQAKRDYDLQRRIIALEEKFNL